MPSIQRGQVFHRRGRSWAYRYYDEMGTGSDGERPTVEDGGEAAARPRRRSPRPGRTTRPDAAGVVDEYLAQHIAERNTIRTLQARLKRDVIVR